ncbi:MAG TPA: EAL domain-containing protein [Gammaproteobacteria bacterium]|nr:EAL domain-containing protein [Gammaproteobacteria bacterium]
MSNKQSDGHAATAMPGKEQIRQAELLAGALELHEQDLALIRSHRETLTADMDGLRERLERFFNANDNFRQYIKTPEKKARLIGYLCEHFLGMLDADIGPERIRRVLATGERHFRLRIPQAWVGVGYPIFIEHLESRLANLSLHAKERRRLRSAIIRLVSWDRDIQLIAYDSRRPLEEALRTKSEISKLLTNSVHENSLFTDACQIIVERLQLELAWIGIPWEDLDDPAKILAKAGPGIAYINKLSADGDAKSPNAEALFERCVRTEKPVIVNDIELDKNLEPWHEKARRFGLRSKAAFPLWTGSRIHAVLLVYSTDRGYFTPELARFLEEIAREISHALTERQQRKELEELHDFYSALSDVNQLIATQPNQEALLNQTIQTIAAKTHVNLVYLVSLGDNHSSRTLLCSAGPAHDNADAIDKGLLSYIGPLLNNKTLFSETPMILNYPAEKLDNREGRRFLQEYGLHALAAIPIMHQDEGIAYMLVLAGPSPGYFTPELMRLLGELASDVAFGLGDLDRRMKLERIQGYYAALGEIGRLIADSPDSSELLQQACELVVRHSASNLAYIAMVDEETHEARMAAVAGPAKPFIETLSLATEPDQPGGEALFGRVYRRKAMMVIDDALHDKRFSHMTEHLLRWRIYAAAGVPLKVNGNIRGVLVVGAASKDHYSEGLLVLLERIASALGSGLARADERKSSQRYQSLYTALSNVNELIARDPEPQLLYEETCRVVSNVDKQLSTCIATIEAESGKIHIAAFSGALLDDELTRKLRSAEFSTNAEITAGMGITGNVYRERRTIVWDKMPEETETERRTSLVQKLGIKSMLGIPIFHDTECVAIFVLGATQANYFREDLVKLSERLCSNIEFALQAHHQRETLQAQAFTDFLTGLPNRNLYEDRLQMEMKRAAREGREIAVALIDLDEFKEVNDRLGHTVGDRVIHVIAERINHALREGDTLARFGGDEIVAILPMKEVAPNINRVLTRIMSAIEPPLQIGTERLVIRASIGAAIYPRHADNAEDLLRRADLAMYRVKSHGGASWTLFEQPLEEQLLHRHRVRRPLSEALTREEFELRYQPLINLKTGHISGFEALLRWNNPDLGQVSPAEFIPLAEESGLIVPIGDWVLQQACRQLVRLQEAGHRDLRVAVNLSPRQFRQKGLAARISEILHEINLDGRFLELEITEGAVMERFDQALDVMNTLHEQHVSVSLDDFGTGYSSLSYLQNFQINHLKIDKSFTNGIPDDEGSNIIARTIIGMAQSLGIGVIAEGIENRTQLDKLKQWNCNEGQGFFLSKPLTAKDLESLLNRHVQLPVCTID